MMKKKKADQRVIGEFPIDKGIPIPQRKGHTKYPWPDLESGDSFLVPDGKINTLRSLCGSSGKRFKAQFIARQMEDGVRIRRTR